MVYVGLVRFGSLVSPLLSLNTTKMASASHIHHFSQIFVSLTRLFAQLLRPPHTAKRLLFPACLGMPGRALTGLAYGTCIRIQDPWTQIANAVEEHYSYIHVSIQNGVARTRLRFAVTATTATVHAAGDTPQRKMGPTFCIFSGTILTCCISYSAGSMKRGRSDCSRSPRNYNPIHRRGAGKAQIGLHKPAR